MFEVREQFRTKPGIMDGTELPDYGRVVDICTRDSLRELITPGTLAVLAPIAVGFGLGYAPLGAYLGGAIAGGVLMAVFLSNSGGAWDNAKKMVEDGAYGGKGSAVHEATVIGDTIGDPFKDTAGPAINPLIKVMNLVSLLIVPAVVKFSVGKDQSNPIRIAIALVAVVVLVGVIWNSKRRGSALDGDRRTGCGPARRRTVLSDRRPFRSEPADIPEGAVIQFGWRPFSCPAIALTSCTAYSATVAWSGSTGVGYDELRPAPRRSQQSRLRAWPLSSDAAFRRRPGLPEPGGIAGAGGRVVPAAVLPGGSGAGAYRRHRLSRRRLQVRCPMMTLTQITLRPQITVSAGSERPVTQARILHLCQVAHRECYVSNSLKTPIAVEPTVTICPSTGAQVTHLNPE